MTLNELESLIQCGEFHHASYRDHGTLWEGLRIYGKAVGPLAFLGYTPVGWFAKDDACLDAAYNLVRASGVSHGSYGQG